MKKYRFEDIPRFCIGCSAMALSLLLFFQKPPSVLITMVVIYLLVVCAIDTLYSKIPNLCNLAMLFAGLTYNLFQAGWSGLWQTLLGLIVGLSLLLIPYLLGGIGGGDVKALAALGALLGPVVIFQVFLYIGLVGGILAILHYLFQKQLWRKIAGMGRTLLTFAGTSDFRHLRPEVTEKLRFPYAAAISFGFFCYVNFGEVFVVMQVLLAPQA